MVFENLHDLICIFLDNGVMTIPKRRILSFVFTVLYYSFLLSKLKGCSKHGHVILVSGYLVLTSVN